METNAPGYGLMTRTDAALLERWLEQCDYLFRGTPLRLLEIGVHGGHTSRGIAQFLKERERPFEYFAVDSGKEASTAPFPERRMIWGDSAEAFTEAPDDLHVLLIDGCHCSNHVILDFCNYGCKVAPDGVVLFHDASPRAQGRMDYQGHGPREKPQFGTAVREALEKLGLVGYNRDDWFRVEEDWDGQDWGGMVVVQRKTSYFTELKIGLGEGAVDLAQRNLARWAAGHDSAPGPGAGLATAAAK